MSFVRKPLGLTAERFVQLLYRDRATEHGWRWRRLSLKDCGGDRRSWSSRNSQNADRPAGFRRRGRSFIAIDGQNYDLRRVMEEIGEAVDVLSRTYESGGPSTDDEPLVCGALGEILRDAALKAGRSFNDLTVLALRHDPYRFGTRSGGAREHGSPACSSGSSAPPRSSTCAASITS
jgi:hypothetical protein